MPRPRKPPRLEIREERDGRRTWVIRDGQRYHRTGCLEDQIADAEQSLCEYLAHKSTRPNTSVRVASQAKLADILMVYLDVKEKTIARPAELRSRVRNLNDFWGGRSASDVRGPACRDYVRLRGAQIAARRELETLRAAIHHYAREYGLDVVPKFTLPEDSQPRERWLTRSEAARLLWAAWRSPYHQHLARFILIGLYTGTRHKAILALQWMPNTTGGWVDLDRGVLHRRGDGERETKKRRPPTRIPSRLIAHLRRWRDSDSGLRFVVRYDGRPITRIEKAFRSCRERAALSGDITPHVLRHTFCTWLAHAGVPVWEAAGMAGMTAAMFESVYGHHHSDFQKAAGESFYGNRSPLRHPLRN